MIVWVLVLVVSIDYGGGVAVVDNISTKQDCLKLAEALKTKYSVATCNAVKKASR